MATEVHCHGDKHTMNIYKPRKPLSITMYRHFKIHLKDAQMIHLAIRDFFSNEIAHRKCGIWVLRNDISIVIQQIHSCNQQENRATTPHASNWAKNCAMYTGIDKHAEQTSQVVYCTLHAGDEAHKVFKIKRKLHINPKFM